MTYPTTWTQSTLSEFIELQRGFDLPHRLRKPGPFKVLSSGEAHGWHNEAKVAAPGFVVGRATNIGRPTWSDDDFWPLNTTLFARDFRGNDPKFAYYWFLGNDLSAYNSGSVQPMLNRNYIANVPINIPPVAEQRAIAATLGALDDKIESNRQIGAGAVNLSAELFSAALLRGRHLSTIGDIADFHNRRRVPLSSAERSQRAGSVPYYGATGVFGYVNEALFNEVLVLVGEDGSVVREDGGPVLQYVWGPAWINNHAHPLTGRGISNETLYMALNRADIRPIVTGAVQPKVNMRNLKSLPVELPRDLGAIEGELSALFSLYKSKQDEVVQLAALRDALLPELLSGRIRVRVEGIEA